LALVLYKLLFSLSKSRLGGTTPYQEAGVASRLPQPRLPQRRLGKLRTRRPAQHTGCAPGPGYNTPTAWPPTPQPRRPHSKHNAERPVGAAALPPSGASAPTRDLSPQEQTREQPELLGPGCRSTAAAAREALGLVEPHQQKFNPKRTWEIITVLANLQLFFP